MTALRSQTGEGHQISWHPFGGGFGVHGEHDCTQRTLRAPVKFCVRKHTHISWYTACHITTRTPPLPLGT